MAEYQMQEVTLPNEEGKKVLFPRMKIRGQVDLDYLAKHINYASTFTPGDIVGLVKSLTGTARRFRTGKCRTEGKETQRHEYLPERHQLPCRQGSHSGDRTALRTEPFQMEMLSLLAAILAQGVYQERRIGSRLIKPIAVYRFTGNTYKQMG